MEFRRFLVSKLILFFILSTLITVSVSLIGIAFGNGAPISYRDMLAPIMYAALCMIPTFVTYSKRELSPKAMLVHLFLWLKDSAEAKRLNRSLESFQKAHE